MPSKVTVRRETDKNKNIITKSKAVLALWLLNPKPNCAAWESLSQKLWEGVERQKMKGKAGSQNHVLFDRVV